jgi:hypothetical protein
LSLVIATKLYHPARGRTPRRAQRRE